MSKEPLSPSKTLNKTDSTKNLPNLPKSESSKTLTKMDSQKSLDTTKKTPVNNQTIPSNQGTPTKEKTLPTSGQNLMSMKSVTDNSGSIFSKIKQFAEETVSDLLPEGDKKAKKGHSRTISSTTLEQSMKTLPVGPQGVNSQSQVQPGGVAPQPPVKKKVKIPWIEGEEPEKGIKMILDKISLHGVPYLVSSTAYDVSQNLLAIGTEMGIVHVIGDVEYTFYYEKDFTIKHLCFATNQGLLIGVAEGQTTHICVWDLVQKYLRYSIQIGPSVTALHNPVGCKFIFVGTKTGSLRAINFFEGFTSTLSLELKSPIISIETCPYNDSLLLIGIEKGISILYDILSKKIEKNHNSSDKLINCSWHPTKDYFASGYTNGTILLWRARYDTPFIVGNVFKGGIIRDIEWISDDQFLLNLTEAGNDKSGIWLCKISWEEKKILPQAVYLEDKITKLVQFHTNPHKYYQKGTRYVGIIKEKQFFIFDLTSKRITKDSLTKVSSFNFDTNYQPIEEVIVLEKVHKILPPQKKSTTWPLTGGKSQYLKNEKMDFIFIRYKDGSVQTVDSSNDLSLIKPSINLNRSKKATCMNIWSRESVIIGCQDNSLNIVHAKSISQFEITPKEENISLNSTISTIFSYPEFNKIVVGFTDGRLDIVDISSGEYKIIHQLKLEKGIPTIEGSIIAGDKGGTKYVIYVGFVNGRIQCISLESGKEIIKKGNKEGPKSTYLFACDEQGAKSIAQNTDILPAFIENQLNTGRVTMKFNEKLKLYQQKPNLYQIHPKTKKLNSILFELLIKEGTLKNSNGTIKMICKNKNDEVILVFEIDPINITIRHRTQSKKFEIVKTVFEQTEEPKFAKSTSFYILNDPIKKGYSLYLGTEILIYEEYKDEIDTDFTIDSIYVNMDNPPKNYENVISFLKSNILKFNIYYKFASINVFDVPNCTPDIQCIWNTNDQSKVGKYLISCTENTIKSLQLPRLKTHKKRKSKLKLYSFEIRENGLLICLDEKGYLRCYTIPDLEFVFKQPLIQPKLFRNLIPKTITILDNGNFIATAQENILLGAIVEEDAIFMEPELYDFNIKFPPKNIGFFSQFFTSEFSFSPDVLKVLNIKDTSGEFCKITTFKYQKREKKTSKSFDLVRKTDFKSVKEIPKQSEPIQSMPMMKIKSHDDLSQIGKEDKIDIRDKSIDITDSRKIVKK